MNSSGYFNLNNFGSQFVKGLNCIIFLYVISIGLLVPPSILPHTNFIGILLLLGIIILNLSSIGGDKISNKVEFLENISYSNILMPVICLLLMFLLVFAQSFGKDFSFLSSFAGLILHVLLLVFIINTKNYLLAYLRSYIYLVLIMACAGLIALSLVKFGVVSVDENFVNIAELSNGSFTRDLGWAESYIFPYNLGLILVGSGELDLLGWKFYRISGWAHEPSTATLFIAPAMILLFKTKIISTSLIRISALTLITFFWFFCMSIGSLFSFILIYLFYIFVTLFIKIFPLKLSLFILCSIGVIILTGIYFVEEIQTSTIFSSKLNLESETFQGALRRLTWFIPSMASSPQESSVLLAIYAIIFLFLFNIFYSFSTGNDLNPFALVVFYIVIHSMKGSQGSVYFLTSTFFWFYILYFSTSFIRSKV
jgi:hypothetical protein